jgi:hypothetical protein
LSAPFPKQSTANLFLFLMQAAPRTSVLLLLLWCNTCWKAACVALNTKSCHKTRCNNALCIQLHLFVIRAVSRWLLASV